MTNAASPSLLQPLPIPAGAFQDLTMDFIEGLPNCQDKSLIFVGVDRFTKYSHFAALSNPYTIKSVA